MGQFFSKSLGKFGNTALGNRCPPKQCNFSRVQYAVNMQPKDSNENDSNNNSLKSLYTFSTSKFVVTTSLLAVPRKKYALFLFTDKKVGIGRISNLVKPCIPLDTAERFSYLKELQEKKLLSLWGNYYFIFQVQKLNLRYLILVLLFTPLQH